MNSTDEEGDFPSQSSHQIDEMDYSSKTEFYDPEADDKDELWVQKQKRGSTSDAVLSCPACFTTLCLDCQRHERYVTRYRAIFVVNCKVKEEVAKAGNKRPMNKSSRADAEMFKHVCCSVCSTDVGVIDEDEVYHFLNVLPSEA